MADDKFTDWQAPPFETTPSYRYGWIEELIQQGDAWMSSQTPVINLPRNLRIFDAIFNDKSKSTLVTNGLRYFIRKFVETISDVREIALYGSDAPQFKPFAEITNRVAKAIYQESQFPRQLRKALQFATVMARGYLWPKCIATDYGWGERQIVFEPLGILDVVPVQIPASNEVDQSYAVTIYVYMPIAEAHGKFPLFQHLLKPVDHIDYKGRIQARRLDFQEKANYGDQGRGWGNLYTEIRYTFIRDLRINKANEEGKSFELPMGDPGTTWFYKVPYVGQSIPGGVENGQIKMREARKEDCRVYPQLRLIISNRGINQPMYDGPAYDWHGCIPPVQYSVDDWVWEGLGLSLIDSVGATEQTKRKHERMIDQILAYKKSPTMAYDRTATGGPSIENFDIFANNQILGVDGEPKKVLQAILLDELKVDEKDFKWLEMLEKMESRDLGLDDLGSLINLKMNVVGGDGFDKALESIGPIAKGIASSMEASNAKVGYRLKFLIPQYLDMNRLIEYVGPDHIISEFFDYEPSSMVPSHMDFEYGAGGVLPMRPDPMGEKDEQGNVKQNVIPSMFSPLERGKNFAKKTRLISVPNTLLKITQMQEQLKWMSLYGRGFPISPHTTAKKLGIEGYGDIPGSTEFEKWMNWKKLEIMIMAQLQQAAASLGIGGGLEGGGQGQTGKQHAGGRPASDKKAPKMAVKDRNSNPRPVIKTRDSHKITMSEEDIIEKNTDYLVTETTIKKDTSAEVLEEALVGRKATVSVCTRMLQGGKASITVIEKTKIAEKDRDAIRQILGMQ